MNNYNLILKGNNENKHKRNTNNIKKNSGVLK